MWWANKIPVARNPIRAFSFEKEIFSDASTTGWGAHCEGENIHGFWKESERSYHINFLELTAAFLALKTFASNLQNCELLLRIDNTTAIAYINRAGGIQYPHLNNLAREIWQWCEHRKLWIFATYIPSEENTDADRESRTKNIDTEWELADFAYNKITQMLGKPEIDLFASRANAKCEKYCAWHKDPEAFVIDAFTISWKEYFFFAFPPFSVIHRVLNKIRLEQAEGIVVAPLWTSQPWFPVFNSLLISDLIKFRPSNSLLLSPCRTQQHKLCHSLTLVAGLLSGRPIEDRISRNQH